MVKLLKWVTNLLHPVPTPKPEGEPTPAALLTAETFGQVVVGVSRWLVEGDEDEFFVRLAAMEAVVDYADANLNESNRATVEFLSAAAYSILADEHYNAPNPDSFPMAGGDA